MERGRAQKGRPLARLFAVLFVLIALAPSAYAQLNAQLDTATKTGNAGGSVTFSGLLQNTGAGDLFLNGFDFDFGAEAPYFNADIAPPVPRGLSSSSGGMFPTSSYDGNLFVVQIDPATPVGVYTAGVTISGGTDENVSNPLAQLFFQIEVTPLPEPGAFLLFSAGAVALALRRRA